MLTIQQIKSARSGLDWGQVELGKRSDVSPTTINNIETGKTTPSFENLEKIRRALELGGAIFTEDGVRFPKSNIVLIEGDDWFEQLLDDVGSTLREEENPELLVDMADDRLSPPEVVEKYRNLRKEGVKMRQTIKEGNTYMMGPVSEYRWIPEKRFIPWVTLIYGDKVALMLDEDKKCSVTTDHNLANKVRNSFELVWEILQEPNVKSTADVQF